MAQEFQNLGPIYLTAAKYEAARTAGTLEAGREYRIVDAMIDGDVIPIDDSTIKLNDDGELYVVGGSSESDIFPITASSVTETTFAVDKTPSELQEALEAGKLPVLFIQTTESFCHTLALSQYKSTYISASFEETIEGRNMLFQINKVGEEDVYEGSISEKTCNTVSVSDTGTAVEEISYITIDGVEKKIAGGSSTQANWSQTDSTAADFIQNKPFDVTTELTPVTVFDNVTCEKDTTVTEYNKYQYVTTEEKFSATDVGKTATITLSGVEYTATVQDFGSGLIGVRYQEEGSNYPEILSYIWPGSGTMIEVKTDSGSPAETVSVSIVLGGTIISKLSASKINLGNGLKNNNGALEADIPANRSNIGLTVTDGTNNIVIDTYATVAGSIIGFEFYLDSSISTTEELTLTGNIDYEDYPLFDGYYVKAHYGLKPPIFSIKNENREEIGTLSYKNNSDDTALVFTMKLKANISLDYTTCYIDFGSCVIDFLMEN